MNPLREKLALAIVPPLGFAYIRFLHATMRFEFRGTEHLERARRDHGGFILTFWHSRFLLMPYSYPGPRLTVLSSRHRDAEMLNRILVRFGLEISRGSSTRGGTEALLDILRKVKRGYDVGITPDGPRGPRRRVKPGVIVAARLAGIPMVPVAFSASPARRLRSWDRTVIPRPFSRGLFLYGAPIQVPRDADDTEAERLRLRVETELDRVTDAADEEVGLGREDPRPAAAPA